MGKWLWEVELGYGKCFVGFWEVDCGVVDVGSELLCGLWESGFCEMWVMGNACGLLESGCGLCVVGVGGPSRCGHAMPRC